MSQKQNVNNQEEIDIIRFFSLISANYRLILFCLFVAFTIAALINHYLPPIYRISASIMIKEDNIQLHRPDVTNYLNSSLFPNNQNFQNELWILKSSPVLENTIRNLDLQVSYYRKDGVRYIEAYKNVPFSVLLIHDHIQPVGLRFYITFLENGNYYLRAESKKAIFYNFISDQPSVIKRNWIFEKTGKSGELIETPDLAFKIQFDTINRLYSNRHSWYGFEFSDINTLKDSFKKRLQFEIIDKMATVVEISLKSPSVKEGIDVLNELMDVYSSQNLEQKNHIATITIDYIERQLNEISDSLSQTEDNLQRFRSSNQLLNIDDQATGISEQYMTLQNQLAELVTRKRYYDYVADYLAKNDNFSNMIVPASLGIQDQLLNNLMAELIAGQAQRSNLIENNQEKNPLVQKLAIQIENIKKTISDNISEVNRTTDIAIDEMNKRIERTRSEISRLPVTQRKLGTIERKYKLNDAIYNYLLEKRAEAKITQASNLPDNIIIEPAKMVGLRPVSPNKKINYLIAFFIAFFFPVGYLLIKDIFRNKIGDQEDIERIASQALIGKIPHNNYRTREIMTDFPASGISESFRSLRTDLDFYSHLEQKKVVMVTSSVEGEGKTFIAINLALSYAQLGRNTILVDFDLRKQKEIFQKDDESRLGLSSYLSNSANIENIIYRTPFENLDYIVTGAIPPNPVELIASERTTELFARLRDKYDIIIIDTPPLANVTDGNILLHHANIKIIVVRQNVTRKKVFSLIIKNLELKNIRNIFLALNDNRIYNDQYGYGYGYSQKGEKLNKRRIFHIRHKK